MPDESMPEMPDNMIALPLDIVWAIMGAASYVVKRPGLLEEYVGDANVLGNMLGHPINAEEVEADISAVMNVLAHVASIQHPGAISDDLYTAAQAAQDQVQARWRDAEKGSGDGAT